MKNNTGFFPLFLRKCHTHGTQIENVIFRVQNDPIIKKCTSHRPVGLTFGIWFLNSLLRPKTFCASQLSLKTFSSTFSTSLSPPLVLEHWTYDTLSPVKSNIPNIKIQRLLYIQQNSPNESLKKITFLSFLLNLFKSYYEMTF